MSRITCTSRPVRAKPRCRASRGSTAPSWWWSAPRAKAWRVWCGRTATPWSRFPSPPRWNHSTHRWRPPSRSTRSVSSASEITCGSESATPVLPPRASICRWTADESEAISCALSNRPRESLGCTASIDFETSTCPGERNSLGSGTKPREIRCQSCLIDTGHRRQAVSRCVKWQPRRGSRGG